VDTEPCWRTPHYFVRSVGVGGSELVFTYGLLTTELARADRPDERLLQRVGAAAIHTFEPSDRTGEVPFLTTDTTDTSEARVLADMQCWGIARDFVAHHLRAFAGDLEQAPARKDKRPSPDLIAQAVELFDQRCPRLRPWRLRAEQAPDEVLWGLRTDTLPDRITLELFELYTQRPRLARCRTCGAIFVPHGHASHCGWALYSAETHEPVAACTPPPAPADPDYRRTYKALHERRRRALAKHGDPQHPAVLEHDKALRTFQHANTRPVGRPPKAQQPQRALPDEPASP
jgi:hypothetical protein